MKMRRTIAFERWACEIAGYTVESWGTATKAERMKWRGLALAILEEPMYDRSKQP